MKNARMSVCDRQEDNAQPDVDRSVAMPALSQSRFDDVLLMQRAGGNRATAGLIRAYGESPDQLNSSSVQRVLLPGEVEVDDEGGELGVQAGNVFYLLPGIGGLRIGTQVDVEIVNGDFVKIFVDGWPIIRPEDGPEILKTARAILVGEQNASKNSGGVPVNAVRRDADKVNHQYFDTNEVSRNPDEWKQQTTISIPKIRGLQIIAKELVRLYPPKINAFICLGNSPAPIHEFLRRMTDVISLTLALSELDYRHSSELSSDPGSADSKRVWSFFDKYVRQDKVNRESVVIVDICGGGTSMVSAKLLLQKYYDIRGTNIAVKTQILNMQDKIPRLDKGDEEVYIGSSEEVLPALELRDNDGRLTQDSLSAREFKEAGYGRTYPTLIQSLIKEPDAAERLDQERYLTIIIEILRFKGGIHYGG